MKQNLHINVHGKNFTLSLSRHHQALDKVPVTLAGMDGDQGKALLNSLKVHTLKCIYCLKSDEAMFSMFRK